MMPPADSPSAQAFVFAQTLDGLELQQRFPVLRPAEIPLDADEVIEADHLRRTATDATGSSHLPPPQRTPPARLPPPPAPPRPDPHGGPHEREGHAALA